MINVYILIITSLIYLGCLIIIPYKFHKIIFISLLLIFTVPYILGISPYFTQLISVSCIAGFIIIEALKNILIKLYLKSKQVKTEEEINKFIISIQNFSLLKIYLDNKKNEENKGKSKKEEKINSNIITKEIKNDISKELAERRLRRKKKQENKKQ